MKPVAIFRHHRNEGPGYFGEFLERHHIPWHVVQVDQGAEIPATLDGYSGIAFLGGPMSVNDPLPWLEPEFALVRRAVAERVPVLGHCLGGQIMSRALGGAVSVNPVKEIGWGEITLTGAPTARDWLGARNGFESFHWHGETFSLPPGAVLLASSRWCANQVFALDDLHLGMQCHVEMTADLIRLWGEKGAREIAASPGPAVQSAAEMEQDLDARVARLHEVADCAYARWMVGLRT